jgi:hypothetical protein
VDARYQVNSLSLLLRSYLPSVSVNRWLSVRLEIVGATIILVSASLSIAALITSVCNLLPLPRSYQLMLLRRVLMLVLLVLYVILYSVCFQAEYPTCPGALVRLKHDLCLELGCTLCV